MNNPFAKENNSSMIAALVIGGVAVAALAYGRSFFIK